MLGITKGDIEFLKQLQHTMLTQDHVCQAAPRFWVVRGTVKEYGIESSYADGSLIFSDEGNEIAENMKEAFEYIRDEVDSISEEIIENMQYDEDSDSISYTDEDGDEYVLYDLEDVIDFIGDNDLSIAYYKNVEKIFENILFLTNDECKRHIKANHYHYPKDAHSYAMTAWRSPEVKRLWEIVETLNWSELEKLVDNE
jgi:hypothetical protein